MSIGNNTDVGMLRSLAFVAALLIAVPAQATEAAWALLRNGGQVVLLVHANAPGIGDPANFDLENCRTQRNLSDRGRQQARRIGALFAARAAPVEAVYTSRYCRARETATLAFGDSLTEDFDALDPVAEDADLAAERLEAVRLLVAEHLGSDTIVLVTHIDNIVQWLGVRPREAEAFVVNADEDGLSVAGRIIFN
jgi:broad specificity phosphatase PhoE